MLEVPDLLGLPRFRNSVLKRTSGPAIKHWFSSYFDPLELRHRQEIINPVQTKVHKYAGSKVARGIVGQPGGGLNKQDLLELGHYQCYARITDVRNGERLPAFSVRLDAPPASDEAMADRLSAASAERYGRNVVDVELDLEAASAHVRHSSATQQTDQERPASEKTATGSPSPVRTPAGGQVPGSGRTHSSRKNGTKRSRQKGASERPTGGAADESEDPAA